MDRIRILQVNKLYYPVKGGIEKVVQQIAEGLNNEVEMHVLTCKKKGCTNSEYINGVRLCRAGSVGVFKSVPLSLPFFREFIRRSREADIVLFHMPFPLGDLACLVSGYEGKVAIWWHSDVVKQRILLKFYKPIMKRFLERADIIFVATEGHIAGSSFLEPFKDKCVVIPYGVDHKIILNANKYVQRGGDVKHNDFVYLFVGRLVYYKGCDILLRAFAMLPFGSLTLIGEGPLQEELKELALELKIEDRVHFLGAVEEDKLEKELANCDVFILPSIAKSEAFGIVQIEAMAYGKPVINTNLQSGVPYVSIDKLTGITVEPGNCKALASAMTWMQEHPDERAEMGRAAIERVNKCYTQENMLKRLLEECQILMGEKFYDRSR